MNKLKKLIIGTLGTSACLAGGIAAEYGLNPDIRINALDKNLTGFEYSQLRSNLANVAITDRLECVNMETGEVLCDINAKRLSKEEGSMNVTWQNIQLYAEILNKEAKKCGDKMYPFENKEDIRNLLKRFDEEGCPK